MILYFNLLRSFLGVLMALTSFLVELVLRNAKQSVELDRDFSGETADVSTPKQTNKRTKGGRGLGLSAKE